MNLSPEARELKNAYQRAWNRKNKDKVRQSQERYYERLVEREKQANGISDNKPETDKINLETDIDIAVSICSNCHGEFTPKRSDAKFCSPSCRLEHHRIKKSLNK